MIFERLFCFILENLKSTHKISVESEIIKTLLLSFISAQFDQNATILVHFSFKLNSSKITVESE